MDNTPSNHQYTLYYLMKRPVYLHRNTERFTEIISNAQWSIGILNTLAPIGLVLHPSLAERHNLLNNPSVWPLQLQRHSCSVRKNQTTRINSAICCARMSEHKLFGALILPLCTSIIAIVTTAALWSNHSAVTLHYYYYGYYCTIWPGGKRNVHIMSNYLRSKMVWKLLADVFCGVLPFNVG